MPLGRRTGGGGGGGGAKLSAARASAAAHRPSGSGGLRAAAASHGVSRPSSSSVSGGASRMASAGGGGGGGPFSALRQNPSLPSRHAPPPGPGPAGAPHMPPGPAQHYHGGPPGPGPCHPPPPPGCHPPPPGCHPPPPGCHPPPPMHGGHHHHPPPPMCPPMAGHRRHHYHGPYCGPHPGFWCGPPRPRCYYYRPYRPPLLLLTTLFVGVPLIRLFSRRNAANAAGGSGARNVSQPLQAEAIAYKGGVHPIKPYAFQTPYTEGRCKGLFIGINYYGTKAELKGCCHDVAVMLDTMKELQFPLQEAAILVDDPKFKGASGLPTRDNIIQHMLWLVKDAKAGDVLFFHFSGHGGQAKDPESSPDNPTGMCETMIPSDYKTAGMIADADIFELMVRNLPSGVRLTVIMDCCHSSSLMDLPFSYVASESNMNSCSKMLADRRYQTRQTRGDVIMFSGVDANEKAADIPDTSHSFKGNSSYGAGGAMTNAFAMVLTRTTGLTINQLLDEMRKVLVSRNILQTPQLAASKPIDLTQPFSFFGDFAADTHYYAAPSASAAASATGQEVELNVWVQPPTDDSSSSSSSSPPPPSYPAATGAGPMPNGILQGTVVHPPSYGSTSTPSAPSSAGVSASSTPYTGPTKQPAPLPPPTGTTVMAAGGGSIPFHMMTPAQQQAVFLQQQQLIQQQQLMLQQQQQLATPPLPMMTTPPMPAPYTYSASALPPSGAPSAPQSQHVTPAFAAAPFPSPSLFPAPCVPPSPSLMMSASGMGTSMLGMGMGGNMMLNPALLASSQQGGVGNIGRTPSYSAAKGNNANSLSASQTPNRSSHVAGGGSAVRTLSSSVLSQSGRNSNSGSPSVSSAGKAAATPPAYRHPPTYEDTLRGSVCSADGRPVKPYVRVGVAGAGLPVVAPPQMFSSSVASNATPNKSSEEKEREPCASALEEAVIDDRKDNQRVDDTSIPTDALLNIDDIADWKSEAVGAESKDDEQAAAATAIVASVNGDVAERGEDSCSCGGPVVLSLSTSSSTNYQLQTRTPQ